MTLKIDLKKLTFLPFCMLFVLICEISLAFAGMEGKQMLSYALLALVIADSFVITYLYARAHTVTHFSILVFLFFILLLVFTIISGNDLKGAVFVFFEVASLIMIVDYYRDNMKMVVIACTVAFSFCIYYNFYYLITNPTWIVVADKDNAGYPLGGNYNQFGCRMLCAMVSNIICLKFSKRWLLNFIPLVLVCVVSLGIVASMTSLSCILLFLIIYMIPSRVIKKIAIITIISITLLFQFTIVFNGNGIENNKTARYIVEDVLGKDITFTMRTEKWDTGMKAFFQSPVIGHGQVGTEWYQANMVVRGIGPHNFLVNLLINGGLVLMAVFIFLCYIVLRKIPRPTDSTMRNLLLSIAILFTMMLMEVYAYFFVLYLFILVYYYDNIKKSFK